jgi:hypothetical protein
MKLYPVSYYSIVVFLWQEIQSGADTQETAQERNDSRPQVLESSDGEIINNFYITGFAFRQVIIRS